MAKVRIYQKPAGIPANTSVFAVEILQNNVWYTRKVSWETIKGLIAGAESLVFDDGTLTFTTPDGIAHRVLSVDSEVIPNSANPVSGGAVNTALAGKQDTLTFDSAPTDGSTNPVESNGIYDALALKQDTLTFDSTPTDGSTNPVTSQGIYAAISAAISGLDWKEAVATYADIATTYPNPEDGWTVTTLDDDHTYRYNGTEWVDQFSLITLATSTKDGLMSAADFVKLSGIEAEANKTTAEDITDVVVDLTDTQQTASANPITLETKQAGLARSCAVSMNPIQDLHGYDHPWVGGAGKNMIDVNINTSVPSGQILFDTPITETVTISAKKNDVVISEAVWIIDILMSDNTHIYIGDTGYVNPFPQTINATPSKSIAKLTYRNYGLTSGSYDIQMERGSTATTFAPYSNICPISGRTEASVTRTGKNLLQGVESGLIDQTTGQDTPNNNNKRSVGYVRANHGSKITLSGFTSVSGGLRIFVYQDEEYVRNFTVSASTDTYFTITIPDDGNMIRFQGSNEKFGSNNIQAELGESATTYSEYHGRQIIIQFNQTVCGAILDVQSGKMAIIWIFYNPTQVSTVGGGSGSTPYFMRINIPSANKGKNTVNDNSQPISSAFFTDINSNHAIGGCFITSDGSSLHVTLPDQTVDDIQKAQTYLNNHTDEFQFAYKLLNPVEIQLSPEALQLLSGVNVIWTDGDKVQVEFSDIPVGDYSVLLDYIKSLEARIQTLEGGN